MTGKILEGLVGLAGIVFVTLAVTKFVCECVNIPELTDDEWEIEREKQPPVGDPELENIR